MRACPPCGGLRQLVSPSTLPAALPPLDPSPRLRLPPCDLGLLAAPPLRGAVQPTARRCSRAQISASIRDTYLKSKVYVSKYLQDTSVCNTLFAA
eukprot:6195298-Pleurochrysis_carterae.AAC.3